LVLAATAGAVAQVTHGFAALTSEGLRRADLAAHPHDMPDLGLVDSDGAAFSLRDYAAGGTITFVNLVYVRCSSVCVTTGGSLSWLQAQLRSRGLAQRFRLLTLSFDPANDTPQVLAGYAARLQADPALWRIATLSNPADLRRMLALFGVVVLPDGFGGYAHNAALFAIGRGGRLERAFDVDRPGIALEAFLAQAQGS
jgi:protein SCO1/2